ncbi:hypothetical protein EV363DRAFT_1439617 [Boletus edulis]|nr:hypothetical protein EV363DRAFT_1439617 [Boletus edulis]
MSDAPELQSAVLSIVENNYITLGILTAIVYDYILTFSDEQLNTWTRVSGLYILVRYCGLCGGIIFALVGSSFLPGPAKMYVFTLRPISLTNSDDLCQLQHSEHSWAMVDFSFHCCRRLCARVVCFDKQADLIIMATAVTMILHVWAIYMQSRVILGILIPLYVLELVPLAFECIKISTRFTEITSQVLDFSFCATDYLASPVLANVVDSVPIPLAVTMCLLVTAQFIRQSLQMYKATKQSQLSRYMNLFVKEGMLYFLAILLFAVCDLLFYVANIPPTGWQGLLLVPMEWVPMITLSPRCILSVRALYERDSRGGFALPCRNVDSGFGFTLHGHSVDELTLTFAPADVGQRTEDRLERYEEIQTRRMGILGAGSDV